MRRVTRVLDERRVGRKSEKKPYAAPKLTVHGDVEEITRFNGGAVTDGYNGSEIADG